MTGYILQKRASTGYVNDNGTPKPPCRQVDQRRSPRQVSKVRTEPFRTVYGLPDEAGTGRALARPLGILKIRRRNDENADSGQSGQTLRKAAAKPVEIKPDNNVLSA